MEKIWLKNYPQGVPAEIDPNAYSSILQVLDESLGKYAARPAYYCMGGQLTFADVDRGSRQIAGWLQSKGLAKGARVAVMMPNILQYPISVFGILRAGMTVVNVNPLYTPRELEHQLKDSGAEVIIVVENFANTVQQVIRNTPVKHVVVATMGDMLGGLKGTIVNLVVRKVKKLVPAWSLPGHTTFKSMLSQGSSTTWKPVTSGPEDIAFLQYTGGTTGLSKGAMLTHRNIVANLLQVSAWFGPAFPAGTQQLMVAPLPLYHIYALTCNCLYMMKDGGANLLIPNPRDIPAFIKELQKYKFTSMSGLNTLYNALLNHPDFGKIDFKTLKLILGRRHGHAERGRRPLAEGDRRANPGGLRPHRDLAGGDDQSLQHHGTYGHHRLAGALDDHHHSRRRR